MQAFATRFLDTAWRTAVALLAGVATGAVLVAAYIYGALGENLVYEGLLVVSLYYGAAIAAVSVPIWLILARFGWDRAPAAAALGFLATVTFLGLTYAGGSHERIALMAYTFVPYGLCGAAAATVTWWVGRMLRAS